MFEKGRVFIEPLRGKSFFFFSRITLDRVRLGIRTRLYLNTRPLTPNEAIDPNVITFNLNDGVDTLDIYATCLRFQSF